MGTNQPDSRVASSPWKLFALRTRLRDQHERLHVLFNYAEQTGNAAIMKESLVVCKFVASAVKRCDSAVGSMSLVVFAQTDIEMDHLLHLSYEADRLFVLCTQRAEEEFGADAWEHVEEAQ